MTWDAKNGFLLQSQYTDTDTYTAHCFLSLEKAKSFAENLYWGETTWEDRELYLRGITIGPHGSETAEHYIEPITYNDAP